MELILKYQMLSRNMLTIRGELSIVFKANKSHKPI